MAPSVDISYRRVVAIAGPVIINRISHTLMGFIDMAMVGHLGVQSLGAVGLAGMVLMPIMGLFMGQFAGVNTLVAQAEGAGDRRAAGVAAWQGVYLALLAGAGIAACGLTARVLLGWTGASLEVRAIGVPYLEIRVLGGFGATAIAVASSFYYGLGRTRVPMLAAFAQLLLNCGLNYALIFGRLGAPRLGVEGAALGTIIAQTSVGLVLLSTIGANSVLVRAYSLRSTWRWHRRVFATLVRLSAPMGAQLFLEIASLTVFAAIVSRLGDAELAANTAAWHTWSLAFMVGVGLSSSATTLVGQCIGAGRRDDARLAVKRNLRLGYAGMAIAAAIYLAFPETIMGAFVDDAALDALRPFARPLFTMVALVVAFDMQFTVLLGALRGAGDVHFPMLVNLGSPWLIFIPATLVAAPRLGVTGAWGCLVFNYVLMAGLMTWRAHGSAWIRPPQQLASG